MNTNNLIKTISLVAALACSSSLVADELKIEPFIGVEYGISQSKTEHKSYSASSPQMKTEKLTQTDTRKNFKIGAYIEENHRVYVYSYIENSLNASYDYIFYKNNGLRLYGGGNIGYINNASNGYEQKGMTAGVDAGLLYKIHSKVDLETGMRALLLSPKNESSFGTNYYSDETKSTYNLFVGLNYNF
ncbi:MAG: hypothetical protein RBT59_07720 [Arcobacteraceae bacterium]|jgi:hypothetical protein|nr:hypothetical protein [Arcobacteraceae bacterium]